ncbi:MAG TPA: hypothetical protein VG889_22570 [Rhizomicrobium sp.]|nr:hypothetical protein [Rhizomicrobium sp.]
MRNGVFPWILAGLVLFGAGQAAAREADNPSLDRILPGIRERHPGKFYDAQGPYRGPDGQMRYRLKWMTPDGRVVWFDADARTGRVLGPGPGSGPDYGPRERRMRDRDGERFREERRFERGPGPRWNGGGRPHRFR